MKIPAGALSAFLRRGHLAVALDHQVGIVVVKEGLDGGFGVVCRISASEVGGGAFAHNPHTSKERWS